MDKYKFDTTPKAESASEIVGPHYRFTLIDDVVLRYEWSHDGIFEDRASTFAIHRKFPTPTFTVRDTDSHLEIITPALHLFYDKQKFSPNGFHVNFTAKMTLWGSEWRFGQAPEGNLGGTARTLDECNGRCDMGNGILSRSGYSILDDSSSMVFDGEGFVAPRRSGDRSDGYIFAYGPDFKRAMQSFYAISGGQPRLPRWSLGNWWSRYYAYSADEYLGLMDRFAHEHVPLSVAVIDMDWHLVHDERVPHSGWTGYTWNDTLFPDPSAFGKALHDRKLKITLNDHPHAGLHHHEELYEKVAEVLGHDTSEKLPILFDPTSPNFMNAWLGVLHRSLEQQACDFWWIDWQQGPISRIPGLDPLWLLNHFHFLDNEQRPDAGIPLIFSRYAGPGSHRYPVGFSGDTIVTWESLQFQPEFTATASNIGYGWWSHDIGGHMAGYRDDELVTRWVQFGTLSPIMRLHSSNSPWASKEPWLYRDEYGQAMRQALQLRHRFVPYMYSMNIVGAASNEPIVQPMYWTYPQKDEAYAHPNQYTFGSSLIVAPIVHPRDKRTNLASVKVWLPASRHVDLFTGQVYDGDCTVAMYRNIDSVPVLAPEGAIIPLDQSLSPSNGCTNPAGFEVLVVVGKDGQFTIREDTLDDHDGPATAKDSIERTFEIRFNQAAGRLTLPSGGRRWKVKFLSIAHMASDFKVSAGGSEIKGVETGIETDSSFPGFFVQIPSLSSPTEVAIDVGQNPQLAVRDFKKVVQDLLLDMQVDFDVKNQIWSIVEADQSDNVRLTRLTALGLDEELLGPLVEAIWADGRQKG